jgi:hypothetical protein
MVAPLILAGGMMAGGALASGIGSYLGGREAKKAAEAERNVWQQASGMMPGELPAWMENMRTGYDPNAALLSPSQQQFGQGMWAQALSPTMAGLSPSQQAAMRQYGTLGAQAFGAAGPMGAFQAPKFDLEGAAQREYGMLEKLLQPGQEKARTGLEDTLFARGMLGSTGGAEQLGAQQKAFEQQRTAAAQQAIGSARAAQQQQYAQALGAYQADIARQQQMFGQGMMATQAGQQLAEQARSLESPERKMALQTQAAQMGMTVDQYEQQLQQQSMTNAMSIQQMYQNMLGAKAGMMAGGAQATGQAAMSPGMLALGGGLAGFGQGMGAFGGTMMANPAMYGGGGMMTPTAPGAYGPMASGYRWGP